MGLFTPRSTRADIGRDIAAGQNAYQHAREFAQLNRQKEAFKKETEFSLAARQENEKRERLLKRPDGSPPSQSSEQPDGFFGSFSKMFYDEKNKGIQWASIGGMLAGLLGGFTAGNFISSAAGAEAGWLGTAAIILLSGAGAYAGSQVAQSFFHQAPTAPTDNKTHNAQQAPAQSKAQTATPSQQASKAMADLGVKNDPTIQTQTPIIGGVQADSSSVRPLPTATPPSPSAKASQPLV